MRLLIVSSGSRPADLRAATRHLRDMIDSGTVSESAFTQIQLREIRGGRGKISGYTWHHHQDAGRMQLVPEQIHKNVKHIGGFGMRGGR